MSKLSALYGALAEGLENAAAAARQLEAADDLESAKSESAPVDAVAGSTGGSKGKSAAAAPAVAAKPAKAAKAPKAPAITFEVLKAKLSELVNTKGKEAAKEILSQFGASKLVDLDEENYAEAHAAAVAAMAEDEEDTSGGDDDMFGD